MALARWNPTQELSTLRSTMDRLFGGLMQDNVDSRRSSEIANYRLPVDITETEDRYVIRAPVPGFEPDEVEITIADGVLSILATHKEEREEEEGEFVRREVAFGNYIRQIALPGDVRGEDVKASFENGMLTVEVPRAQRPKPVRVEVQHSEGGRRRQRGEQAGEGRSEREAVGSGEGQAQSRTGAAAARAREGAPATSQQPQTAGSQDKT
jgi:HSP20 family protein